MNTRFGLIGGISIDSFVKRNKKIVPSRCLEIFFVNVTRNNESYNFFRRDIGVFLWIGRIVLSIKLAHNTYHVFGATNFGRVKDTRVNSKYYSNPET